MKIFFYCLIFEIFKIFIYLLFIIYYLLFIIYYLLFTIYFLIFIYLKIFYNKIFKD